MHEVLQEKSAFGGWHAVSLVGALTVSLALNVSLGWKVDRLEYALTRLPSPRVTSVGTAVPLSFNAVTADGRETIVSLASNRPTVLYIFSPTCPWCEANQKNITFLVASRGMTYAFVGISLSDFKLSEYMQNVHPSFPVYTRPDRKIVSLLGLGNTPQTIVISSSGRILGDWVGAYAGGVRSEVQRFFGEELPGISQ